MLYISEHLLTFPNIYILNIFTTTPVNVSKCSEMYSNCHTFLIYHNPIGTVGKYFSYKMGMMQTIHIDEYHSFVNKFSMFLTIYFKSLIFFGVTTFIIIAPIIIIQTIEVNTIAQKPYSINIILLKAEN